MTKITDDMGIPMSEFREDTSNRRCEICKAPIPFSWQAWAQAILRPGKIPGGARVVVTCLQETCKDAVKELEK